MTTKIVREYLGITIGIIVMALGLDMFLVPNKIAAGGVSGIATILYHLFRIPVGVAMLVLNVPLFLVGIRKLGVGFGIRSLYGTIGLSLAVDVFAPYSPIPTHEPLLASLYGGILVGIGLGLVFRFKATTGGTDLAAAIVNRYLVWASVGFILFVIDALVIVAAGLVFNAELALYALITVFLTAKVIDVVQEGFGKAKAALIISDRSEEIGRVILKELDRGATVLKGQGVYTGTDKKVILSVVSRSEISILKELVHKIDPRAFVILTDIHEVLGEGFKGNT